MKRLSPRSLSQIVCLCALACSGTETDNPIADGQNGPPSSGSPTRFEPPAPAPPGCVPDLADAPPRDPALWAHSEGYLVGFADGLVVVGVRDPSAPVLVARQALAGYPRQLLLEGRTVSLVIDELPMFDAPPLPAPSALAAATRLIRYDLADPTAPRRLGDVAIDGEFWQLVPRQGSYWVMSARVNSDTLGCDVGPNDCGYVDRQALVLQRYVLDGETLSAAERVELPLPGRVWSVAGGFATATSDDAGGDLHFSLFDAAGALSAPRSMAFTGRILDQSPLYLGSDRVAFFAPGLHIRDLEGNPLGSPLALNGVGPRTRFVEQGVFVASQDVQASRFVDWANPSAPIVTPLANVADVWPLDDPNGGAPTRALAWYQGSTGLRFSWLSLETAPPSVLSSLDTEFQALDNRAELWLEGARGYFRAHVAGGDVVLGAVGWEGDFLTLQAPLVEGYADEVVSVGTWSYATTLDGLHAREFASDRVAVLELSSGEVLDFVASGESEAALVRGVDGALRVELGRTGATESVDVSPGAERLLPAGERVAVFSGMSLADCQQLGSDCANYRPQVAIVAQNPARVLTEIALPEALTPGLSALSRVEQRWSAHPEYGAAPLAIGEDLWILVRELSATCFTEPDCSALGIDYVPIAEANVIAGGQVDCGPGEVAPCNSESLPEPTVYGTLTRRSYFVLDSSAETLSEPVNIDVEGDTLWADFYWPSGPIVSGQTVLALRLEALTRSSSGQATSARFLLDRASLSSGGGLHLESAVPIPGYPVGLLDATTLLSVEPAPGETGAASLVRSLLTSTGAQIEARLPLDARFGSVHVVGDYAVYLHQSTDACEPVMTLESVPLDFSSDRGTGARQSLSLTGEDYRVFATAEDNLLLTDSENRAFARVRVGADGALSLEAFATAPGFVQSPSWQQGILRGARGSRVRIEL